MKKTTGNLERRLAAYGAEQKEKAQKRAQAPSKKESPK